MRRWIVIAVVLAAAIARSSDPAEETFESTFARLSQVHYFAFGGVGITGRISQGEMDYRVLLARPSAMADFEKLLSSGNLQAKSYALAGIRTLNPKMFRKLSRSLRDSEEQVQTLRACLMSRESLNSIFKRIEAGEYSIGP